MMPNDTSRAAFEAWLDAPFSELPNGDGGRTDPRRRLFEELGIPTEIVLHVWKAARAQGLEEAATLCARRSAKAGTIGRGLEAIDCAHAIRALAKESGSDS